MGRISFRSRDTSHESKSETTVSESSGFRQAEEACSQDTVPCAETFLKRDLNTEKCKRKSVACGSNWPYSKSSTVRKNSNKVFLVPTSSSKCPRSDITLETSNVYRRRKRPAEKCYIYTQTQPIMSLHKEPHKEEKSQINSNTSTEEELPLSHRMIQKLSKRLKNLEDKIFKREMVFNSIDPNVQLSSSEEECKRSSSRGQAGGVSCHAGCSYIEQYSRVPDASAFQRIAPSSPHPPPGRSTALDKEHNSERYGRDYTTYDGMTARGRRQCVSMPCKRDELPKFGADRVHKIRHKLNPVRDYRLMDTVHYLAQGEFAPRDDGIKLTPSREAVLSDIIWEDVCRTHWPTTRLGRRNAQSERCNTRSELQRLIDSLLRERVAHVERRRRRHYRIVKLNHRHENCRTVGKTGDIIVASHKKKEMECSEGRLSGHDAASATMSDRRWERGPRRAHRSHDRLERRARRNDDCSPGPSYVNREPTYCYNTEQEAPRRLYACAQPGPDSSESDTRPPPAPRLLVKRDPRRKHRDREEPNLEQYILLPTLVIRTPSNVKRQKKFNELYHRILNVQVNEAHGCACGTEAAERKSHQNPNKKDIGLNINITLPSSQEQCNKRKII